MIVCFEVVLNIMFDFDIFIGKYIKVMYELMDLLFEIEIFGKNVFVDLIIFFDEKFNSGYLF